MISIDVLKRQIRKWSQHVGRDEAMKRLKGAGLSQSISTKLVGGTYEPELGFEKAQRVMALMAKDGFTLTDEKAS